MVIDCDGGTSYAAPAVAGLISLLIHLAKTQYSDLDTLPIQVIKEILNRMRSIDTNNRTLHPMKTLKELNKNPNLINTITEEETKDTLRRKPLWVLTASQPSRQTHVTQTENNQAIPPPPAFPPTHHNK